MEPLFNYAPSEEEVREKAEHQEKRRVVRSLITMLIFQDGGLERLLPYFTEDGVTGHKVMDLAGAVNVLRDLDACGALNHFQMKDVTLGYALLSVLREHYTLSRNWKIDSPDNDDKGEKA